MGGCSYCQDYALYLQAVAAENQRIVSAISSHRDTSKEYALVPTVQSSGFTQYTDLNGHGYLNAVLQNNGELAWYGTEAVIGRLLGRSELDRYAPKMKSGRFSDFVD